MFAVFCMRLVTVRVFSLLQRSVAGTSSVQSSLLLYRSHLTFVYVLAKRCERILIKLGICGRLSGSHAVRVWSTESGAMGGLVLKE